MQASKEQIRKRILELGADVCGFAPVERFGNAPEGFSPCGLLNGAKSVISFGVALPKSVFISKQKLIYGYFNYDICREVDRIALKSACFIEDNYNTICLPVPADGPYEYWDEENLRGMGLISMKHAAEACGVGAMGKNTILVNEDFGNRLVLGAVITEMEIEGDEIQECYCIPGCDKCEKSCPVGAISQGRVDQKKCRLNTYSKNKRGFDTVECNACRAVCPNNLSVKVKN